MINYVIENDNYDPPVKMDSAMVPKPCNYTLFHYLSNNNRTEGFRDFTALVERWHIIYMAKLEHHGSIQEDRTT